MDALNVIIAPVITEKSMNTSANGRYTFKVSQKANKKDIKKAIEDKFKVNVLKISTITIKGRTKNQRTATRNIEISQPVLKKSGCHS